VTIQQSLSEFIEAHTAHSDSVTRALEHLTERISQMGAQTEAALAAQTTAIDANTTAVQAVVAQQGSDATTAAAIEANTAKVAANTSALDALLPPPPLTVTQGAVTATVGQPVTFTVAVTGGVAPYTVTVNGLPASLVSANGDVTGAVDAAGTSTVTVDVTDSAQPPNSATGTFTVTAS
jgi:hypothetical protein